jgi:O-antigen/teichoic acid export membrane protein
MAIVGGSKVLSAAIFLVILLAVVRTADQIVYVALAAFTGDLIASAFVLWRFRSEHLPLRFSFNGETWKTVMRQSFPMGIGSVLAHLSVNFPVIYLGITATRTQVGLFSAATKFIFFLLMIDRVLGQLLLPASSRLQSVAPASLKLTLELAQKWILVLGFPIAVGGALLAEPLLAFAFGPEFVAAAIAFRLLLWYFFFTLLHTVYTSAVIATGGEREYRTVMIVSSILFGSTTILGAAIAGIEGVALGVCLSEAITLLLMRRATKGKMTLNAPTGVVQIFIATLTMCTAVVATAEWNSAIRILVGAIAYSGVVLALKGITKEEIQYLREKLV